MQKVSRNTSCDNGSEWMESVAVKWNDDATITLSSQFLVASFHTKVPNRRSTAIWIWFMLVRQRSDVYSLCEIHDGWKVLWVQAYQEKFKTKPTSHEFLRRFRNHSVCEFEYFLSLEFFGWPKEKASRWKSKRVMTNDGERHSDVVKSLCSRILDIYKQN